MPHVHWLDAPQEHDYPAAASYLNLIAQPALVEEIVADLRASVSVHQKAKDILRSSGLELLEADNPHVASDLAKIKGGKSISPILLVRGDARTGRALQIADGYHRVCASYHADENTDIPCHIADLPYRTN